MTTRKKLPLLNSGCNDIGLLWLFFSLLLLAGVVQAQSAENEPQQIPDEKTTQNEVNDKPAKHEFVPPPDDFDWVQLKSGEWLKGTLKVVYERKLEFDSDELDLQKFDMVDVKRVRTAGIKGIRFEGPVTLYGRVEIIDDKVIVFYGKEKKIFPRSRLISIAHGEDSESDYWSAKVSLGLNFSEGNTKQVDYASFINLKRRTSATRFVMDYFGNYSKSRSVETVNNNRLSGYLDLFRTRKYYLRPVFGEYYNDVFQNIRYRVTLGTGLGYHLINTSETEWDITGGLAYQETRFESVEAGENIRVSTPALVAGTRYETELNSKIDFELSYSFNLINEESGQYTHHFITTLENEITSWLDFDVSFVWDRIEKPTPGEDGSIPEKDDYKLLFSLGLDY